MEVNARYDTLAARLLMTVMRISWNLMVAMVYERVHIQTSNKKNEVQKRQLKREIGCVICKALMLVNQMHGSFNDFDDVLTFAKDLFFPEIEERWRSFQRNLITKGQKNILSVYMKVAHVIGI